MVSDILSQGSNDVFIVIITSTTAVIIGWLQYRRSGKIKDQGDQLLHDSKPNEGNSSRDILDRLDRRSLAQEERFGRMERRFDRVEEHTEATAASVSAIETAAAATRVHVSGLGKVLIEHTERLDTLEGGK